MLRMIVALALLLVSAELAAAQTPIVNTTVQLPTTRNFSINTVVSVPDGGTLNLTGGTGYAARRPAPRTSSRRITRPGASVSPTLIIGAETDAELERRGRIAIARRARPDIFGTRAEKAKASFLAKHLGRGWK